MKADADAPVLLVTGSSGLIGGAFIESAAKHFRVVGFDRGGAPHPPPDAECVCVDLTSKENIAEGLKRVRNGYGSRIASVIHLAAFYDFSGEPSPMYEKVTVRGTGRLLRALHGFEVGQFVFSSTMLVHAPTEPGRPINENSTVEPTWPYPESKVRTEELIRRERGEIPTAILRIAGVYDQYCNSIPLAHQIQRIHERQLTSRVFPGDISRGQSFIHLEDLVAALLLTVNRRAQLPQETVLLLGEPETLSYDEIQRLLGQLIHDEEWQTRQIPKALAKTGAWLEDAAPFHDAFIKPWMIDRADDHYELDTSRAETLLGWKPRHRLRDTLPEMVAALKENPLKFYQQNKLDPPADLESS